MTAKEQKIKEAYGEHWESMKEFVDENGWLMSSTFLKTNSRLYREIGKVFRNIKTEFKKNSFDYRPKQLSGIENNNGWISMEGEITNILPTEKGDYFGLYPDGTISCFFFNPEDDFDRELFLTELTHYQPIIKPNPPIY